MDADLTHVCHMYHCPHKVRRPRQLCSCSECQAADPTKCRHGDGTFDDDCCAGSDASESPGYCADGYVKEEGLTCAVGNPWCDQHGGCRSYACVPHGLPTRSPTP